LPKIRFKFADVFEEVVEFDAEPTHTVMTEEAEPGLDDSSYGFPSQAFVELHDLALSPFKRVYVEILDVIKCLIKRALLSLHQRNYHCAKTLVNLLN
jgi:hypothetical protein